MKNHRNLLVSRIIGASEIFGFLQEKFEISWSHDWWIKKKKYMHKVHKVWGTVIGKFSSREMNGRLVERFAGVAWLIRFLCLYLALSFSSRSLWAALTDFQTIKWRAIVPSGEWKREYGGRANTKKYTSMWSNVQYSMGFYAHEYV